ncbi:CBS domain-containing protein [Oscillatoria sp. FACHB-1407]|uniref:CBS domain-containing protein n=1 Tax=Oscillatoria sp. FACHB-1407 TaxID=2692847 RepID=UPI001684C958|nr:CBS domain-containing protein [Oscillatoria sp. FACHB-1407]MBD2464750.1 CBS domain-containing protein [Oscillatoria sp. FACHB-1407]
MVKASDIMTRDVVTIRSSATLAEAIALMQVRGWRSLIVERDNVDDAYGIITETDIACQMANGNCDPEHVRVHEVMTKPCIVVNPDLSVDNVLKLFARNRLLRAPVIRGELLGIISISDILVKSHLGEELCKALPNPDLQALAQQARTAYTEGLPQLPDQAATWDTLEEKLSELSQQQADQVLKTALEEYFKEFEALRTPAVLDNLCSG